MILRKAFVIFSIALWGCSPPEGPHRPLSSPSTQESPSGSGLGFADVRPVFEKHCSSCHPSVAGPNWLNYDNAIAKIQDGSLKRRLIDEKSMPPPGSPQAMAISEEERQLVARWLALGAPRIAEKTSSPPPTPTQPDPISDPYADAPVIAKSCLSCHGSGAGKNIPHLDGQQRVYLQKQIHNFQYYERVSADGQMNQQVQSLSESDIQEVSKYFSELPHFKNKISLPDNLKDLKNYERGKQIAKTKNCSACHHSPDMGGNPSSPIFPIITGQAKIYLRTQLSLFARGIRGNDSGIMQSMVKDLTNDDLNALAVYYSQFYVHEEGVKNTGLANPINRD
tara:strand:+ start:5479 stop:6489 length:1011 start_codon:yes stop_codon:yes gene_type:complete